LYKINYRVVKRSCDNGNKMDVDEYNSKITHGRIEMW
jgi:hypothetical protein